MKCINCQTEILNENINIQADIAKCHHCNSIFKISETISSFGDDSFDINNTPSGAWIKKEINTLIIGASTRSPIAFFMVPFMIVWSGFSIGGIYGSQLATGNFNFEMSLFGIPFIIGSIIFWSLTFMAIFGKVELTLDKKGGKVFTGVFNIGIKRNFTWDEISSINEKPVNFRYPGSQGGGLQLEGKKRITFGSGLNEARKYYLLKAMKMIIYKAKSGQSFT